VIRKIGAITFSHLNLIGKGELGRLNYVWSVCLGFCKDSGKRGVGEKRIRCARQLKLRFQN